MPLSLSQARSEAQLRDTQQQFNQNQGPFGKTAPDSEHRQKIFDLIQRTQKRIWEAAGRDDGQNANLARELERVAADAGIDDLGGTKCLSFRAVQIAVDGRARDAAMCINLDSGVIDPTLRSAAMRNTVLRFIVAVRLSRGVRLN